MEQSHSNQTCAMVILTIIKNLPGKNRNLRHTVFNFTEAGQMQQMRQNLMCWWSWHIFSQKMIKLFSKKMALKSSTFPERPEELSLVARQHLPNSATKKNFGKS